MIWPEINWLVFAQKNKVIRYNRHFAKILRALYMIDALSLYLVKPL